jgi:hypothetical protein
MRFNGFLVGVGYKPIEILLPLTHQSVLKF